MCSFPRAPRLTATSTCAPRYFIRFSPKAESSMDESTRELVRGWLVRASHDLRSSRVLSSLDDPLLDTAIYHSTTLSRSSGALESAAGFSRRAQNDARPRPHSVKAFWRLCRFVSGVKLAPFCRPQPERAVENSPAIYRWVVWCG